MHGQIPPRKTVRRPSSATLAFLALVLANVALAFGPWFVRQADTGPVAAAFWRITLAAPVIGALALGGGARPQGRSGPLGGRLWAILALAGVVFALDLGTWHIGIRRTTLANATLFGNSTIIIYPIYGFIAARSWPTRGQAWALVFAAAGGALLMGRSYSLDPRHLGGDLFCLLAGVFYTVYLVLMARARTVLAPLPALALSTIASIVPLLVFATLLGETIVPHVWWPLVALALVSQVLGQSCMTYALGRASPLVIGITLLVQPIVATIVGWLSYGERPGTADLVGAVLVAAALVLIRVRKDDAREGATPIASGALPLHLEP